MHRRTENKAIEIFSQIDEIIHPIGKSALTRFSAGFTGDAAGYRFYSDLEDLGLYILSIQSAGHFFKRGKVQPWGWGLPLTNRTFMLLRFNEKSGIPISVFGHGFIRISQDKCRVPTFCRDGVSVAPGGGLWNGTHRRGSRAR